jgi:hypothetical protein
MKVFVRLSILMSFFLSVFFNASGQEDSVSNPYIKYVGIHAGTQGFGASATLAVSSKLSLEAGMSFLPVNRRVFRVYNSYNTESDASARFSNVHLLLNWTPFVTASNLFRHFLANAGIGYFFKADGHIDTRLADDYHYGEIIIEPHEVGALTTDASWKGAVAPYLGAGLQHMEIVPRLGIGVTVGSYYLRAPDIAITGTNLLEGNESNTPVVQKNLKSYRFLPVLQLNFSYQIK